MRTMQIEILCWVLYCQSKRTRRCRAECGLADSVEHVHMSGCCILISLDPSLVVPERNFNVSYCIAATCVR